MLIRLNKILLGFIVLLIFTPIFGQIIPRIYFNIANSEYKKNAFLNYAIGTTEQNYSLNFGTKNTGVSIKNIHKGNIIGKKCLHENTDIISVTLTIHTWFAIPNGEVLVVNCK
jgi:hypothetical protein